MKTFKLHYSGKSSKKFWKAVNETHDDELYALGCNLQGLEGNIVEMLNKRITGSTFQLKTPDGTLFSG